jgi:hypothetical protein
LLIVIHSIRARARPPPEDAAEGRSRRWYASPAAVFAPEAADDEAARAECYESLWLSNREY